MQYPPVSAQRSALKRSWLNESLPLNLGPDQPWFLVFFWNLRLGTLPWLSIHSPFLSLSISAAPAALTLGGRALLQGNSKIGHALNLPSSLRALSLPRMGEVP